MGRVVALSEFGPEPSGNRVAAYHVQPYWFERTKLGAGRVREYASLREARAAAKAMSESYVRVEVYSVIGDPKVDEWEPPTLLEVHDQREVKAAPVRRVFL